MGPAKLLSALVALGVVVLAGAQSSTPEQCPPCTKMMMPVCAADEEDETKTFPNSCIMRWCNCMLRNADADRSFKQLHTGYCDEVPSNETDIPECFPDLETTTESTDDDSTTQITIDSEATPAAATRVIPRTQNTSEETPPVGTGLVPQTQNTSEATPPAGMGLVPQTQNTSEATPPVGTGLVPQTQNTSEATPPAGMGLVPQTHNTSEATPTAGTGLVPRTQNTSETTPGAGARLVPGCLVAVVAVLAMLLADHL